MNDTVHIEGGQVFANLEDRTLTARLIPFNEEGRTNVGRFMVEAGTVDISESVADPSIIGLNLDHVQWNGIGRATRVWEQADGVYASWSVAKTPAGDAALADAVSPAGRRKRVSAEFGPVMIRAGKLVAGHARLWGSALVEQGAFPSAMVLATDTPDPGEQTPTGNTTTEGATVPEPIAPVVEAAPVAPVAPAAPLAPAAPAAAPIEQVLAAAAPLAPVMPVPSTFQSAARVQAVDEGQQVFAALNALRTNPSDSAAMQVLAAIADITMSGTNPIAGAGVLRPAWLGKIYQGIEYVREYIQLGNLGTQITAAGKLGMRVNRGAAGQTLPPQDGSWLGNKTPINGYPGNSSTLASMLYRFAVGNDIDRSLYDLPGGWEVVLEFLQLIVEDYLYWSDRIARETFVVAGGALAAPVTYPAIYTTNNTTALAMAIQGILAVRKRKSDGRRDQPTFAILNDLAFEQLAYAAGGDQNLPEFVSLQMRALEIPQSAIGNVGQVQFVNGDTGILGTPSVLVGAGVGVDFDELPGGPLIIDAVDLAKGGIDKATHGYLQTFVKRPEAFVHVGAATESWTASTAYAVGTYVKNGGSNVLQAVAVGSVPGAASGVSGGTAPTNPAVGATVNDGSVTWKRVA